MRPDDSCSCPCTSVAARRPVFESPMSSRDAPVTSSPISRMFCESWLCVAVTSTTGSGKTALSIDCEFCAARVSRSNLPGFGSSRSASSIMEGSTTNSLLSVFLTAIIRELNSHERWYWSPRVVSMMPVFEGL